jgi:hypothetical protein
MSRNSILNRPVRTAIAGLFFVGLLSPANATSQHDAAAVFPDLPISATAQFASAELTSHQPWLAPVGHRQPQQADVPQQDAVSAWEREQQQDEQELDRKLVICRGC